ncbi:MAG: hypothetical protein U1F98_13370 [Verrucomicrobiota bacterium]
MKTFIAGGGLGDCVLILNKYRQLAGPDDRLVYYLADKQKNSLGVIREFWDSQKVPCDIQIVPEIATPLGNYDRRSTKKLNPLIYGMGCIMVERWKFVRYPFDAFATPYLKFESTPPPFSRYCVIQSDAGTMKYRGHKNWLNTGWIEDFIAGARQAGLKCVVVGSRDVGIRGADHTCYNVPLKELFGILENAEFVLGLQGFITIIALFMRRPVLLKRENVRVILNYFHPRWRHHGKIFTEPDPWPEGKTQKLLDWTRSHSV